MSSNEVLAEQTRGTLEIGFDNSGTGNRGLTACRSPETLGVSRIIMCFSGALTIRTLALFLLRARS